ncbi:hypothetical protein MON38_02285 [Hymenobacter sp. DH14]|uniref:Uncharacterized protein n=1 Tax=Hymenobacter cyanobacteriorum TaxID=2926463 RepID=A0A9X2ADZ2_9BACT|nr:hypothetical protein [Hymenobacter cyanobacteriorum]MCI1186232.1 hypothetical protein [Hymenobacter cyanobacteriorum]
MAYPFILLPNPYTSPSTTGPGSAPTPKKGKTKDVIPSGELELATLGLAAADAWDASPLSALLWYSKAQLRTSATAFKASIKTADAAGTGLSPAAQRLAELDELMDRSLKFVRNHLVEAHDTKKKAKAYYADFGLQADGQLRSARPSRAEDLAKLVAALKTSDYDEGKYGTAFWKKILDEYKPLVTASSDTRSESAKATGGKNQLEEPLRKMLRAMRQHIKTNFPNTYAAEWRGFGYLKESY